MPLRPEVANAFAALGLDTDADRATAREAYKKLALLHHPDKSKEDDAKERFQKIGHAWDIVQKHYDNPAWSENAYYDDDDDGEDEEDDSMAFFMFLFEQTLRDRYTRARGRNFRDQQRRSHPSMFGFPGGSPFAFFGGGGGGGRSGGRNPYYEPSSPYGYTSRSSDYSRDYNPRPTEQSKEQREYEQRLRELEEEVKREKAEEARKNRERKASAMDRAQARDNAFAAARRGDQAELQRLLDTYELNVGATNGKQRGETLVHAAARSGRGSLVDFLVGRGAPAGAADKDGANAYHVAAGLGLAPLMAHLLERYPKDFHASRALPDGRTPLLLAVRSGAPDAVAAVVRFAPTHDVGRCWTEVQARLAKVEGEGEKKRLQDMLDALRTKKGFVPPGEERPKRSETPVSASAADDEPGFNAGQSKKAIKRRRQREREAQEAAEAEKRKEAEREARLVEQRARTAESQRRKEDLAREQEALIAREEQALEEAKRLSLEQAKLEEEARRRAEEDARRAAEAAWHAEEARRAQEVQQRAESERRRRAEEAARLVREQAEWEQQHEAQRRAEQDTLQRQKAERARAEQQQAERERSEQQQAERAERRRAAERDDARRRQEDEWVRRADAEREREAAAQARLDAIRREEEAVRQRARETEAELERLRAEAAALRAPLSPPATPETLRHPHGALFDAGFEAVQTAAEADYLFDPPGMQRPAPTFTPEGAVPSGEAHDQYGGRGRGRGYYRGRGRGRGRGGYYNKYESRSHEDGAVTSENPNPAGEEPGQAAEPPAEAGPDGAQTGSDQSSYYSGRGRGYYRGRGRGRGRGGYGYYNSYSQDPTADEDASSPVPSGDDAHEGQAGEQDSGYRGRGRGRGYYRGRGRGYYSNNYHYDHAAPAQVEGDGAAGAAPLTPADEAGGDGDGRGRGRGYYRGRGRGRGYYKNYVPREDGAEAGPVDAPASPTGADVDGAADARPAGYRGRGRGRGYFRGRGRGRGAAPGAGDAPTVEAQ